MKNKVVLVVLAALLALSFLSCGENGKDNKPETAAAVLLAATPLCMTSTGSPTPSMTIEPVGAASFQESAYYGEISNASCLMHKVVFNHFSIDCEGRTYEMNGTLYFAFATSSYSGGGNGTWGADIEGFFYAKGLSVSGPDFDSAFDADCKASVHFSMTNGVGSGTATASASLSGMVAGQEFADAGLSISATFTY